MLKMSSQIENIINAYKTLTKIPSISGGKLNNAGNKVTATWSVRNLDKGKNTKYVSTYAMNEHLHVVAESDFGMDISNELLSAVSPQETFRALIREEKNGKDTKKQYLEVWNRNTLAHCIDLTALDIHGDVYADSEFGSLGWSYDETSLVYVAEKKLHKSEPFIKRKTEDKPKSDGSGETMPKKGEEFLYRQDWGEQLVGKHLSVIVVCKLSTESFTVLEGLPSSWCPGQVRFAPNGKSVVGVAWETEPRRLGLIFCTNRPSWIFSLTLDGNMKKLSHEGLAVRSPRYSPLGDLVWLQRKEGGPHHAGLQLVILKNGTTQVNTVTDVIQREVTIENDLKFYGLYCQALPRKCFSSDGERILLSTPQKNEIKSYVLNVDGTRIVDISNKIAAGSTSILDVRSDIILASCSNMATPAQLFVAKLPAPGSESKITWLPLSTPDEAPHSLLTSTIDYLDLEHADSKDAVKSFNALYFAPKASGKKLPLIVWPHGGPHSNFVNTFSLEAALFNMLGFGSLQINFRGSTGVGQASVKCLLSKVGDFDVKDCKLATDEALKKYPINPNKVGLFGGSHGGFLVTHLSGQYPDVYKAVVSRNPVIDIASFASTRINFRGSTGQGEANVRCLLSHVGDYDVKDCHLALTTLLKSKSNLGGVFLYGGSFGGFVVGHLAGVYPDMFRAMVMKNPLIDLATKGHYADNADGCAVEAGYTFTERGPVSEDMLVAMRRCSPLAHVHNVRAPTALMLGGVDKRVPHYQGLEYARRLKANGVPTRIYMYDDNHSLSSPPAEMDNLINSAHWFIEHLQV